MAQAVGDQAKLRRLKEQEERMSEPEPNTDEIRPPIYGLMAALAEMSEKLNKTNEVLTDISYRLVNIDESLRDLLEAATTTNSSLEKINSNLYDIGAISSYLSDKLPNK